MSGQAEGFGIMSRRVLLGFIFVNVIVSLAVAAIVVTWDRARRPKAEPLLGPTQIVILTATPLPGSVLQAGEYQGTIDALQVTLEALGQAPQVAVVTATQGAVAGLPEGAAIATIDPALLPPVPTDLPEGAQPLAAAAGGTPDDGCIRHVVQAGEVVSLIAQQYGVFPGDVLAANDMEPDDILHIGDVLLIPTSGCAALFTPTPVPSPTNTPFSLTRVAATVTLPPAAENAQIAIVAISNYGDINTEMIELRNVGERVNLEGWTLVDEQGNTFTFPGFYMPKDSRVRIYTRQGTNTPAALYWGRDTAVWSAGEVVTLNDALGMIQATARVGDPGSLAPG